MPFTSPTRGGRVVQVMALVIWGLDASSCWQTVVFPAPEGAEMSTSSGAQLTDEACETGVWVLMGIVSITRRSGLVPGTFPIPP